MDAPPSSSLSSHNSSPLPEEEKEDPRERQHLQEVILSFLEYSKV